MAMNQRAFLEFHVEKIWQGAQWNFRRICKNARNYTKKRELLLIFSRDSAFSLKLGLGARPTLKKFEIRQSFTF